MIALELKNFFNRYAGANNDFYERLSLVTERLLKASNTRAKDVVNFAVYPDANNQGFITLPAAYTNVLGAIVDFQSIYGYPIPIQNDWYGFIRGGTGVHPVSWMDGMVPLPGFFTTFATWSSALKLRFKLATTETEDKIIVRGRLSGVPVYSTDSQGNWIEGIEVAYSNATVTTTQKFDEPPYAILKPVTLGVVSMFTVDDSGTETAVGIYYPSETYPQYRRYKVPVCPNLLGSPTLFTCVCKRAFTIIRNDTDEVFPSNLGAIRHGLKALQYEDSDDDIRAERSWAKAESLLAKESDDDTGAGAEGKVPVDDDFGMVGLGAEGMCDGWGMSYGG